MGGWEGRMEVSAQSKTKTQKGKGQPCSSGLGLWDSWWLDYWTKLPSADAPSS